MSSNEKSKIYEINQINNDATILMSEEKYDEALDVLNKISAIDLDDLNPEAKDRIANAYCKIGYLQMFVYEDYMESYEALTQAKEIAETLPESNQLGYIYINLAALYKVYADTRSSAHYLNLAFDDALYHKKYDVLLTAAFNILNEGFNGSLPSDSRQRLKRLSKLSIPEHPMKEVVIRMLNAYLLNEEGKSDKALEEIEKIRNDSVQYPVFGRLSELCDILSLTVSMKSKNPRNTITYAANLEEGIDSLDSDNKLAALFQLAESYHANGNNDKGYYYYDKAFHLKDSIFSVGKYSLLHDWELKNKEKRHAAKMKESLADKHRLWKIILGVSILLIVLAATVTYIAFQNKKLKSRNKLLFRKYKDANVMEEELLELRKEREELLIRISQASQSDSQEISDQEESISENTASDLEDNKEDREKNNARELIMLRALTPKVTGILNSDEVTSADFSLDKLAKLTGSNRAYVSKVINNLYKKNFKTVLNDIRIRIACQRLREPGIYRHMTIEALTESLGYKSRSYFVVTFKKITGLSPSEYRKAAEL